MTHRVRRADHAEAAGRDESHAETQSDVIPKYIAMRWVQCLTRLFGKEIQRCEQCRGSVKITATIRGPFSRVP